MSESEETEPFGQGRDQLSPKEVNEQLERMVADPALAVSARDRSFLRYVVGETLAGRGERIKAYSIATEVFGGFTTLMLKTIRWYAWRLGGCAAP